MAVKIPACWEIIWPENNLEKKKIIFSYHPLKFIKKTNQLSLSCKKEADNQSITKLNKLDLALVL